MVATRASYLSVFKAVADNMAMFLLNFFNNVFFSIECKLAHCYMERVKSIEHHIFEADSSQIYKYIYIFLYILTHNPDLQLCQISRRCQKVS